MQLKFLLPLICTAKGTLSAEYTAMKNRFASQVPYMKISTGEPGAKDIDLEFKLFWDDAPKTALNFAWFLHGFPAKRNDETVTVGYKKCPFHRIIPRFMMQGGDFMKQNGLGSHSIYNGKSFADEKFVHKHKPFVLSMANSGPNTNGSQFFITFVETPHLNGKHVVFGEVMKNFTHGVKEIEKIVSQNSRAKIVIKECGLRDPRDTL
ncbi:peptidyl-prolyl isomerase D [Enteropsectra breve]|nr:peptidyl-prolyl isomerase D [Enteropsectra breve]